MKNLRLKEVSIKDLYYESTGETEFVFYEYVLAE